MNEKGIHRLHCFIEGFAEVFNGLVHIVTFGCVHTNLTFQFIIWANNSNMKRRKDADEKRNI
jgi:hypothetical protein